ncbi:MAG: hypothetical protein U0X93_13865 [Anaerolineales bacterium]
MKQDIDLNRVQSAGWANLFGGLGGSARWGIKHWACHRSRIGSAQRVGWRTLISATLCGLALFFGASVISFFPKPVLGGMLLYTGLSFLVDWLIDALQIASASRLSSRVGHPLHHRFRWFHRRHRRPGSSSPPRCSSSVIRA